MFRRQLILGFALVLGFMIQGCAGSLVKEPQTNADSAIYGYLNTPWGSPWKITFIKQGDVFGLRDAALDGTGAFFVTNLQPGKYVMLNFFVGDKEYDMFDEKDYFEIHPGELHHYGSLEAGKRTNGILTFDRKFEIGFVKNPNAIETLEKIKGIKDMAKSAWLPIIDNEIQTLKQHEKPIADQ